MADGKGEQTKEGDLPVANQWYPAAIQLPINRLVRARPAGGYPNILVLHVAVSEASSLYGFFSRGPGNCSHFYLRKDGTFEQYLPINSKSGAESEGNYRAISVETQGGVHDPNNEPWTDSQVVSLAHLAAWLHDEHGIPLRLMNSSKPSETGVGWHRLGIDGNFPAYPDPAAGRSERGGGEVWSKAPGKICPGLGKINQIPTIVQMAQQMSNGEVVSTPPSPVSNPLPTGPASGSRLVEDGYWGPGTTRQLQYVLGTPMDGVISSQYPSTSIRNIRSVEWSRTPSGSTMVRALQTHLNRKSRSGLQVDGLLGPSTIRALQVYLGTPRDGYVSNPSTMVKMLQKRLNQNTF